MSTISSFRQSHTDMRIPFWWALLISFILIFLYSALMSRSYFLHCCIIEAFMRTVRIHCIFPVNPISRSLPSVSMRKQMITGSFCDSVRSCINKFMASSVRIDFISITGVTEYLLQHAIYCSSVGIRLSGYCEAFLPFIIGYCFISS